MSNGVCIYYKKTLILGLLKKMCLFYCKVNATARIQNVIADILFELESLDVGFKVPAPEGISTGVIELPLSEGASDGF